METVVDVVGNEEARVEDYVTSPQMVADPVVYQLVRVDDSGRLVPATDDEVIAVEDLLIGDETGGRLVANTEQILDCNTKYGCRSDKVEFKGSEGIEQYENIEIVAEIPHVSPDRVNSVKTDGQNREPIPSPTANAAILGQSGCPEGCSELSGGSHVNESSSAATGTSSKPEFSLLKGEIRLNDLSVRDLQETFRATFGRETYVKDKQWLKRRIIMGLTNSCDFSTTTLVITDNEVVMKCKEDTYKSVEQSVLADPVRKSALENHESTSTSSDKQNEIHSNANGMNIEQSTIQDSNAIKDPHAEGRPTKRFRKPTKRYIEEISEEESMDSRAKTVSSVRQSAHDQPEPSAVVCARPIHNLGLDVRCFTRKDSLGGYGIQVPYVSRIRRSRPRENFMTLMKIQPSGMDTLLTGLIKDDVASSEQLDNGSGNEISAADLSSGWIHDSPATLDVGCKPYLEGKAIQLEEEVKLENMESCKNSSDEEMVTVATSNGSIRRKHHRPWALSEVVKLVEGVAKYGVGRWSEIKRLAFASYSYRTPVDLKDKWRNLLRASVAELPARNGTQSLRKQASVPIPAPILWRVRELADIHLTHVPLSHSSSKIAGCSDSNKRVHEIRSGFL